MKGPFFAVVAAAAAALAVSRSAAGGAAAASGTVPGEFTQDYDAAMAFAASNSLPVMLDFSGSDWCYWCRLMDERVFAKAEWKTWAATNLVLVLVDFPRDAAKVPPEWRGRNGALAAKYGVRGYPTFVVTDASGNELGRAGASRDATPERFAATLGAIVAKAGRSSASGALSEEESAELARLRKKVEELSASIDGFMGEANRTTEQWRTKIAAAKDAPPEKLAELRRAATREIAQAMSAAQAGMADARKRMEEAQARIDELRMKSGEDAE